MRALISRPVDVIGDGFDVIVDIRVEMRPGLPLEPAALRRERKPAFS